MHHIDSYNCVPDVARRKEKGEFRPGAMAECDELERQSVKDHFFGQEDVECIMCGDVGFADQLLLCTGCKWHVQHSYCCTSREGAGSGAWLCDWCRLPKQCPPKKSFKGCKPHPIIVKPRSIALDFLVQVALSPTELGDLDMTEDFNTLNMDSGSLSSSNVELDKLGPNAGFQENVVGERERDPSSEKRIATSDEEASVRSPRMVKDGTKKKSQWLRCTNKLPKQASLPEIKSQLSSLPSHRLEPRKLKRLSSLKASTRPRISPPVDGDSKGFTPRFKSLLDISC